MSTTAGSHHAPPAHTDLRHNRVVGVRRHEQRVGFELLSAQRLAGAIPTFPLQFGRRSNCVRPRRAASTRFSDTCDHMAGRRRSAPAPAANEAAARGAGPERVRQRLAPTGTGAEERLWLRIQARARQAALGEQRAPDLTRVHDSLVAAVACVDVAACARNLAVRSSPNLAQSESVRHVRLQLAHDARSMSRMRHGGIIVRRSQRRHGYPFNHRIKSTARSAPEVVFSTRPSSSSTANVGTASIAYACARSLC